MTKKTYSSIGKMLTNHDFEAMFEDLEKSIKDSSINKYLIKTEDNPFSEMDYVLFHFPLYAVKKEENENYEDTYTGELYPKALECLDLLLQIGCNPNAYMTHGETSFLNACKTNSKELIQHFLENKHTPVPVDTKDGQTKNALYYGAMFNAPNTIELLINEYKLDPNEKSIVLQNQTPIFYAATLGNEEAFNKLVEMGADLTVKDIKGRLFYDMMLPAFDEETIQSGEYSPEELDAWKKFYDKTKSLATNNNSNKKTFPTNF